MLGNCAVLQYFVSFIVLQSSRSGGESLVTLLLLLNVM